MPRLVARARFSGGHVAAYLGQIASKRPAPTTIGVDNGTQFTSRVLDSKDTTDGLRPKTGGGRGGEPEALGPVPQ